MAFCNRTHDVRNPTLIQKLQRSLPFKFQDSLICAGDKLSSTGVCKGDSGGPLIQYDSNINNQQFVQIGVVHGGMKDCYNDEFPAIFNRLTNPKILEFVYEIAFNREIDTGDEPFSEQWLKKQQKLVPKLLQNDSIPLIEFVK